MERRYEGAWTKTHCAPGDVSLLTRSRRSHWRWTEEIDVSHVYLTENLLSGVCADATDRCIADVGLHDVLKSHDPIVTAAVAAITREAQQQAMGSALYVEAVATQLAVHLLRNYASVTFREPGVQGVSDTWTLGGIPALPAYAGWEAIEILSPMAVTSNHANFKIRCLAPSHPGH